MRRVGTALVVLAAAAGTVAWACAGDGGPLNQWRAEASAAMLTPANDTRSNFVLLMADRFGTRVADPRRMAEQVVPLELEYRILIDRMAPVADEQRQAADPTADWGLSEGSDYDWSRGNLGLCHSNRSGAAAFIDAVSGDRAVPSPEKKALIEARTEIAQACDKAGDKVLATGQIQSPAGRAYLQYLEGARLFYAEAFDGAASSFDAAAGAQSPWLRETAAYMRFRNSLAAAVATNADEYGDLAEPEKRDIAAIDRAEAARQAYLSAYPSGRYARSAAGLGRRIAWVKGDRAALGSAYSAWVGGGAARDGADPNLTMIDELDRKVMPAGESAGITDPTLLAVIDLMRLRPDGREDGYVWDYRGAKLERAELERQRPLFKSDPALFEYLLAVEAYFNREKPREVLALIPDAAHQQRFSYVQFSRQMLRGLALEAVKDRNARAFWLSLLPGAVQPYQRGAVELAIYQHVRAAGVVGRLLETGSPILHPLIRSRIIEMDATPDDLRRTIKSGRTQHERETALYMLLGNELRYGMYQAFLADQLLTQGLPPRPKEDEESGAWSTESYDPDYGPWPGLPPIEQFAVEAGASKGCPTLRATVTGLSQNATAVRPLLCLAEFIRDNGYDNWDERYMPETGKYELNPRPAYGKQAITRARVYQLVMDNTAASDDDKAFALNRAIRCYEPTGRNDCGGAEVPLATRKAWFQRLKTRYANTSWAKELKYYW